MTWFLRLALAITMTLPALWHATAAPPLRVVVSIKPIHSLAAALLDGIAQPNLLVDGAQSPHSFALRPSQARALRDADVVIWVGPELEGFLAKSVTVLPDRVRVVGLLHETPGLERLHRDEHDHDHDHKQAVSRGHEAFDPHMWLSPQNARAIAAHLTEVLGSYTDSPRLGQNAAVLDRALGDLDRELRQKLTPVRSRPFVVMHPAYNYLVRSYGLNQIGIFAANPEQGASAGHLSDLRNAIAKAKAVCVFAEPQFGTKAIGALAAGAGLRSGLLDPLGADIAAGPGAYSVILQTLANAMVGCLGSR